MAVVFKPSKEDEELLNQPESVSGPAETGPSSGTNATQGQAPGISAPTQSGRFTNLNNYIKANASYNAPGGGVAGQVASGLQNQGKSLESGLNADQQAFQSKAQSARVQENPEFVKASLMNPTQTVQNQQNLDQWNRQLSGKYTGPQGLSSADQLMNKAQDYKTQADQTTSESGRFNLLQNMFAQPTYSQGQQKLDNLFLQAQPGQAGILTGARSSAINVGNNISKAASQASQAAQNYNTEAEQANKNTLNALTGAYGKFNTDLDKQAADAKAADDALLQKYNQYQTGLQNRTVDPELAELFRLQQGQRVYNVNLGDYLQLQGGNGATRQTIATPEQAQQLAALQQLGGNVANLQNDLDPSKAGQYVASTLNPKISDLTTALRNAENNFRTGAVSLPYESERSYDEALKYIQRKQQEHDMNFNRNGTSAEKRSDEAASQRTINNARAALQEYENRMGFNNLVNYLTSTKPSNIGTRT